MYADFFEFNGLNSEDLGYRIINFDNLTDGAVSAGNDITFNTSKPSNSYKWNFHGSKYEEPLTTSFQIMKIDCNTNGSIKDYELSNQECAFLQRWLNRPDGYKYMRFFQGGYEGYENTFFNVKNKIQWLKMDDRIIGAQIDVTCDAPFGYSGIQTYEIECSNGSTFMIYDDSDKVGSLYFNEIDILMTSDASNLQIKNSMDAIYSPTIQYVTSIKNCRNGESIHIANHQIASSMDSVHTKGIIANDFNFKYPRLINFSDIVENRKNTYTVTGGSCHLFFEYRTIRTVMP